MNAPPAGQWLAAAMSAVLRARPNDFLSGRDQRWTAPRRRARGAPRRRHGTGLHQHPFAEICIALQGTAVMDIERRCHDLCPPRIAVLEPTVEHCEGFAQRARPYALLWLSGSGAALLGRVCRYCGTGRWDVPAVYTMHAPLVQRLFDRFAGDDADLRAEDVDIIRAELLSILGELHLQAARAAAKPPADIDPLDRHREVLEQVRCFVDEHRRESLSVPRLAELTDLSPNYLNTLFRRWTGQGIHAYQIARRMDEAMRLCRHTSLLIKQIARRSGYDDPLYFSRAFRKHFGVWPSACR